METESEKQRKLFLAPKVGFELVLEMDSRNQVTFPKVPPSLVHEEWRLE